MGGGNGVGRRKGEYVADNVGVAEGDAKCSGWVDASIHARYLCPVLEVFLTLRELRQQTYRLSISSQAGEQDRHV